MLYNVMGDALPWVPMAWKHWFLVKFTDEKNWLQADLQTDRHIDQLNNWCSYQTKDLPTVTLSYRDAWRNLMKRHLLKKTLPLLPSLKSDLRRLPMPELLCHFGGIITPNCLHQRNKKNVRWIKVFFDHFCFCFFLHLNALAMTRSGVAKNCVMKWTVVSWE